MEKENSAPLRLWVIQSCSVLLFVVLLLLPLLINAEEGCGSRDLLSLTPPVVGYSTVEGTIYNALPFSYERRIHDRAGIRVTSSLIYYESAYQAYSLKLGVPVYLNACSQEKSYYGFYAAPLVTADVRRRPGTTRVIRGGFEAGDAWPVGGTSQFVLGYWHIFDSLDYKRAGSGLTISFGYWF